MALTHSRSSTPPSSDPVVKKLKTKHATSSDAGIGEVVTQFADGLFETSHIQKLHTIYGSSKPYKYAVLEKLFQDRLLVDVKDECLQHLSFTEKETDIYKVRQTGDLASLSYLSPEDLSRLPSILTLRNALYSAPFRKFLRSVTGCGPLSESKQDMSIVSYVKGCHLLNHDDVIGTRRVSYILYLPLPHTAPWKPEWGGALELYPTTMGADGILEPESMPSKKIPPSWNQFIFFEVQPGKSFHSVEEVVVGGEDDDGRARLSISGWFHAAQEGEEGYEAVTIANGEVKSSREQLRSTSTNFHSYADTEIPLHPETPLTRENLSFLSEFLNPIYLQRKTMKALAKSFGAESSLNLHDFLRSDLAEKLEPILRKVDAADGLDGSRGGLVPAHTAGTTSGAWTVKSPPHKWRYCTLKPHTYASEQEIASNGSQSSSDEMIRSLQDELFTSNAFRSWLSNVTTLLPLKFNVQGRRFRPGLDYTLATSDPTEARLDVVLALTPEVVTEADSEEEETGWQSGDWGGWECYMAPHEEEDDPAVYRSGSRKKKANGSPKAPPNGAQNVHSSNGHSTASEAVEEAEDIEEEEEDHTLLTVQPGYNRLLLAMRDATTMRFVKYVSAAAEGSRWDICGEYEVGTVVDDSD